CAFPDRLQYAEPEDVTVTSFPVGTTLKYVCRPGFMRIPGKPSTRTCERKCKHPGELENGVTNVTDLTFGSKATFSCVEGFRLLGPHEISCVIKDKGVNWDRDLPFCEKIPCAPPPSIVNGHYTEAESYVYQTAVTYKCDKVPKGADPFSLIGSATIFCTTDKHSNGIWSHPPPQCKVVKCDDPKVENGRKKDGFGLSYTYMNSVVFECDPGYFMIGPEAITCGENSTWSQKPTCEKSLCDAPKITHGVVIPVKSVYEGGESVQIKCNTYCAFPDGTKEMTVTCQGRHTWNASPNCTCSSGLPPTSGFTPEISYGRVIEGQKPSYSAGDFITIECYAGYTLHGEARIQYVGENQWVPGVPTCQLKMIFITLKLLLILPKVTVAIVVSLAAIWVYKACFSQNGKCDSTPCTAEYKSCKA
ncbi:C4b-binding protein alpha chain, partial [Egretta garzetta]